MPISRYLRKHIVHQAPAMAKSVRRMRVPGDKIIVTPAASLSHRARKSAAPGVRGGVYRHLCAAYRYLNPFNDHRATSRRRWRCAMASVFSGNRASDTKRASARVASISAGSWRNRSRKHRRPGDVMPTSALQYRDFKWRATLWLRDGARIFNGDHHQSMAMTR